MRIAAILASALTISALLPGDAHAGGIGLVTTGGFHTERVYFYDRTDDDGNLYVDWRDYEQRQMSQSLGNGGAGIELVLGDRDDRILGVFRGFWNMDTPQLNPADVSGIPAADVVANHRERARHSGIAMIGLSWGIVGDPSGFQFGATGHVGSGFLTNDHTEFLTADIGLTANYRIARQMQAFADVVYVMRYRKEFSSGANAYLGVRYLFD